MGEAERLLELIQEALESHPDPAFARKAAVEVIREWMKQPGECPVCGYDQDDHA